MLEIEFVRKRKKDAEKTLEVLENMGRDKITITKKALIGYCEERIMFCDELLNLLHQIL